MKLIYTFIKIQAQDIPQMLSYKHPLTVRRSFQTLKTALVTILASFPWPSRVFFFSDFEGAGCIWVSWSARGKLSGHSPGRCPSVTAGRIIWQHHQCTRRQEWLAAALAARSHQDCAVYEGEDIMQVPFCPQRGDGDFSGHHRNEKLPRN